VCQVAARHEAATVVYETLRLNLTTATNNNDNDSIAGLPVCTDTSPPHGQSRPWPWPGQRLMSSVCYCTVAPRLTASHNTKHIY